MNKNEFEMIEILKILKNEFGVVEIKAEFEAEGSRIEELMRLKDITSKVNLPIILKIGGAEAVTDVYNGIILGVEGLVAPMVETPYSVSKYLGVIDSLIQPDNRENIDFAINIETITAVKNIEDIMNLNKLNLLSSITFGRSDFVQSMGLNKHEVDSDTTFAYVQKVAKLVKLNNLKFAIGGNITKNSIEFIKKLQESKLIDKYETRKVVFESSHINNDPENGLEFALKFELLWLKSKRRFYSKIREEDESRILELEKRIKI
ncbi:aldolase/citrate lyase family protein [Aliarcobacter butzleri]|uniref:aldolase/citrate lyase family protein n=1 Tax=Aliarcobacter butzleri TaxID=28197 RepID=UPI001ED9D191|nr:aldolase/citrate lyase family protein [Aliarcobacter butzleri]MCG3676896.1 aldolase/citrate lyase family protein [Aliarcobacter butzleri]